MIITLLENILAMYGKSKTTILYENNKHNLWYRLNKQKACEIPDTPKLLHKYSTKKKPTKLTSKTLDLHWDAKLRTLRNIFESQIMFSSIIVGYVITIEIQEWMLKVNAHFRKIVSWYERYFVVLRCDHRLKRKEIAL